jgi:hypothetical protein
MSVKNWNAMLQHAIDKLKTESHRRWSLLDHSSEKYLNYDSEEYKYGIVHGLHIAQKLLDIAKVETA